MENFVIRRNQLSQWIIVYPSNRLFGWSGSRWVAITESGLPIDVQICNFAKASEAALFAEGVRDRSKEGAHVVRVGEVLKA